MTDTQHKKILYIDLTNREAEVKTLTDLYKYVGGVSTGLPLLLEKIDRDPIVFSTGPLNGFFPFASKTSVVFHSSGVVEDLYLGGSLSTRLKFAGIDSIVLFGKSDEPILLDILNEEVTFRNPESDPISGLGLPGKKSEFKPVRRKFFLDDYFLTPESFLDDKLLQKNIFGLVVTGTKTFEIQNSQKYEELYYKILGRCNELSVEKSTHPSCAGCPMGCAKSRTGEIGGNLLLHSLVACAYAESIYSNIGVIFSCLNVLGYDYTHEDLEALPSLTNTVLEELT